MPYFLGCQIACDTGSYAYVTVLYDVNKLTVIVAYKWQLQSRVTIQLVLFTTLAMYA